MIDHLILRILSEQEALVIPGFGALVFQNVSSRVDVNSGRLSPMGKKLRFQPFLKHQDGILMGAITQAQSISYGEANVLLQKWISNLQTNIQKTGFGIVEGVGRFYLEENDALRFAPEKEIWPASEAYGLYPFFLKPIQPTITAPEPVIAEIPQKSGGFPWKVAAAIAIPLGIAAVGMQIPFQGLEASFAFPSFFDEPIYQERIADESQIEVKAEDFEWQALEVESTSRYFSYDLGGSSVAVEIENAEPQAGYYLIQGCFRNLKNAEKQLEKLHRKGFDQAQILDYYKGLYRIALFEGASRREAQSKRQKYARRFKGLWVSKVGS